MTYKNEKISITLEEQEINDFWNIIIFALLHNTISKDSEKTSTFLNDSQTKLAEKLEEISRPSYW